jgi:beta-N-acetylhexosaminidase
MSIKKTLSLVFLICLLLPSMVMLPVPASAQTPTPPPSVARLLDTLTPEERVGQLFLVTFTGTDTSAESQIYDLIFNHHIGGVVLQAENGNFFPAPDTLSQMQIMVNDLQRTEWETTLSSGFDSQTGQPAQKAYIPLFVGISQDGDGYPGDQILNGLTPLPSAMAVGATWRPDLAQQIGFIQGQELSALGINLLFGPSLDVLETPNPNAVGDILTRSFGGDPFWVGEMGRAYINGLHTGSDAHMLVVAKHFPGTGGSDRPLEEEVATVRKSLEQLKQIEIAPFMAVTGDAPDLLSVADALLVSHIRYLGFQGNIRATTRPISFDQSALSQILDIPQFAIWRERGGIMISDDLSSLSVRNFYAPGTETFSPRLVARDAFFAGNDLLYLGNISSDETTDTYSTILSVLDFFSQRYREDPAFALQVDAALERILVKKNHIFERFLLSDVIVPENGLAQGEPSSQVILEVARQSVSLISPGLQELTEVIPSPPGIRDRLVFITDTASYSQCEECPVQSALAVDALENAVLRLYGLASGGQVSEARLSSFSFEDLNRLMAGDEEIQIERAIANADWVVLSLTDVDRGQSELVSRFLSGRQDLLREKYIILFSFTAPYYLDATDISNVTAYFGLYSKQPAFIDAAARLLYQEITPLGYSPVSIPGTGYDMIEVTTPNPEQVIRLILDPPTSDLETPAVTPGNTLTPQPTPVPLYRIGDSITVHTGEILDHNNNIVPDGTVVRFSMLLSGEGGGILQQVDTVTTAGVAKASFGLENPGLIEIHAVSEPAILSEVIQMDVSSGQASAVTVIAPLQSETPAPTSTPEVLPEENRFISPDGYPRFNGWIISMLLLVGSIGLTYWVIGRLVSLTWGVRWALCAALGGLLGFNYLALGLPGSFTWTSTGGIITVLILTIVGELFGMVLAWLWMLRSNGSGSRSS